jgi:hypothetical protein
MMQKSTPEPAAARERIRRLQARIARFDLVSSGTIHVRTKVCGKPGCRCATDPQGRHGPYHEWSRLEQGTLVHSVISPAEARQLKRAIANYRNIMKLLKDWQQESIRIIRENQPAGPPSRNPRN